MVAFDRPPADIVLCVEGTANLGAYIEDLKQNYILPTLTYFNGGPPDPIDYGHDYSCTLYNLVTFYASDIAPDSATRCSDLTTSTHQLLKWLDGVPFIGGCGETHSHISEGLRTALHVFDDIKEKRNNDRVTPERHCILICNSPPYHLPSMEGIRYTGYYSDQLANMLAKRSVNLSILSPRKIPALQKLYEEEKVWLARLPNGQMINRWLSKKNNSSVFRLRFRGAKKATTNEIPAMTKDFSIDLQHLVLLHGFQLQERAHTPVPEDKDEQMKNLLGAKSPAPPSDSQFKVPTTAPSVMSSLQQQQPSPQSSQQQQSPLNQQQQSPQQTMTSQQQMYQNTQQQQQKKLQQQTQVAKQQQQQQPMNPQANQQLQQDRLLQQKAPGLAGNLQGQGQGPQSQGPMGPQPQGPMGQQPQGPMGPFSTMGRNTTMPGPGVMTTASQGDMSLSNRGNMPGQGNPGMGVRQPNPQMTQDHGAINTIASMATGSQLSGGIQSKPGMTGDMTVNPASVGGAMPRVSQGGGVNVQMSGGQITTNPGMNNPGMSTASGMGNPSMNSNAMANMGGSGIDPVTGLPTGGPMNQSQLGGLPLGVGPTQGAPGTGGAIPDASANNQLNNRTVIWRGQLEWQDKKSIVQGPSSRITRNLGCMVSIGLNDPEINTSNWPSTLIMQLMPQTLLNSNQLHPLFRNSRQVAFHFHHSPTSIDHLKNLYKVMGNGFAGCVHFTSNTPCDIRVLLLLFSNKRRSFVGLIPNDQSGVVNGIRQVITQHKQRQQAKLMTQFGQNPMVVSQAMGLPPQMQQTPQNPMAGPGGVATGGMPRMDQPNMGMGGPTAGPSQGQMPGGGMGMQQGVRPGMPMEQDSQMVQAMKLQEQKARQQQMLDEMYYGPQPNVYNVQQQQLQQQQRQQLQLQQQQQQQQQQQLRHMMLNQQRQQQQQQQQQMMLQGQGQGQPGMMGMVQQGMPQGPPGNMPPISQPQQQNLFMDDFDIM